MADFVVGIEVFFARHFFSSLKEKKIFQRATRGAQQQARFNIRQTDDQGGR